MAIAGNVEGCMPARALDFPRPIGAGGGVGGGELSLRSLAMPADSCLSAFASAHLFIDEWEPGVFSLHWSVIGVVFRVDILGRSSRSMPGGAPNAVGFGGSLAESVDSD